MLLALALCFSALAAEPAPDPVVARVEGIEITASEFAAAAKLARPADGVKLSDEERTAVLDKLVGERLLFVEAAKRPEVLQTPKVRDSIVQTYLAQEVYASLKTPSEAELEKFYEGNKALFMTPATVRASRILVRVGGKVTAATAKESIDKLYETVRKDPKKTFATTAKASSQDLNKAEGGDMGLISRTDKKQEVAMIKALFGTKVGTVSRPFLTKEGYNLVWVTGVREPAQKTFEQSQSDVERRWKMAKIAELKEAKITKLEKGGRVQIDKAALAAVALPERKPAGATGKGKGAAPAEADVESDSSDDDDDSEE